MLPWSVGNQPRRNGDISVDVYDILTLYYSTTISLDNIADIADYQDEVLGAIISATDLSSMDKILVQSTVTIGKYSALLSFSNYN